MQTISALPKGTNLSRFVSVLAKSKGNIETARSHAAEMRDCPGVLLTLRAVQDPMALNASALAQFGISAEYLALERGSSVLGRLTGIRPVPFLTKVTREIAAATAVWISETAVKGVGSFLYDTVELPEYKLGVIVVLDSELVKFSRPSAEAIIRQSLTAAVASFLDAQFLDASVSQVIGTNPASITNGAETVTSTGSSGAQILADLSAMTAKLGSWISPYWIMRPSTAAFIAGSSGTLFPSIRALADGGFLMGIPVLCSTNSPAQIVLLDSSDVLLADDGAVSISLASQTSLNMDDNGSPSVPRPVSLWQNNMVALRVERYVAWLRGHSDGVVSMSVSY